MSPHYDDLKEKAGVLHFLGKSKPWNDKRVLKGQLFDMYASETPWWDEYIERRRRYEKEHFMELKVVPKGSIRRKIYLKIQYGIKRVHNVWKK